MNPDWMIDKNDCVCESCTRFDLIPRAETVNEPSVALMHGLDCLPQRWFCGTRPACLVLYRIDLSQWQVILLATWCASVVFPPPLFPIIITLFIRTGIAYTPHVQLPLRYSFCTTLNRPTD